MNDIIKPTLILAIVAFTAAMALSHVQKITAPSILKQEKQKQDRAISLVLPGYTITATKKATIQKKEYNFWIGEKKEDNNTLIGYAFITEKSGYSGLVKSMVGITEDGKILGISILQQTETPGLGARATEIASTETFFSVFFGKGKPVVTGPATPWFQEQFKGLDTTKKIAILKKGDWTPPLRDELIEKNAISAITGATITSRTVRDSIVTGIKTFTSALEIVGKEEQK